jgi:hypothetical protein
VEFDGKTAVHAHVYDGVNGWKLGASPNLIGPKLSFGPEKRAINAS